MGPKTPLSCETRDKGLSFPVADLHNRLENNIVNLGRHLRLAVAP